MEKRNKKGQFEKGHVSPPEVIKKIVEVNQKNQHAAKLTEPELKEEAYKQYCAWIAAGWSKESFVFKHPSLSITHKTMERYIREFPNDFPPLHKEIAESESLHLWEEKGLKMMEGQVEKCQPAIYQMMMRNKFKWDKEEKKEDTLEPTVRKVLALLENVSLE